MKNSAASLNNDGICIVAPTYSLRKRACWLSSWLILFCTCFQYAIAQAPPANFSTSVIGSGWNQPVGLTFSSDGNIMFVWEKGGKVWTVIGGIKSASPLLDISPEVANFGDHGLIGFAIDPNFNSSGGAIYLMYAVDRHYLLYFGTSSYDPAANEYNNATIGRIARYAVQRSGNTLNVNLASRTILLGESKTTSYPILHDSHGVGSLVFGSDGTLMATIGDGASYNGSDVGAGTVGVNYYSSGDSLAYTRTYAKQALLDGILTPQENVGVFRAQMLSTLSGKILRLDPATGNGVSSNPYYNAASPRSARSRIWALGLRNSYRMTRRPDTGSSLPSDGNPGVFYAGEVGFATWEELNIIDAPGQNFGWPFFEGLEPSGYSWRPNLNPNNPNPLYNGGSCPEPYFRFRDVLKQPLQNGTPSFPNPCNASQSIPSQYTFVHTRPVMDWKHGTGPARVGTFTGGTASVANVGATGSPVTGPQFAGNASTGGVWYTGDDFPAQYKNTYFHADYGEGWLRNLQFDGSDNLLKVSNFIDGGLSPVCLATNPVQGGLYYINYSKVTLVQEVRKVYYSSNRPPEAIAQADKTYGVGPLTVQFTGSNSSDPEGGITYLWSFGDGSPNSTTANPSHVFNATAGVSTPYTVTLTVRDNAGATDVSTIKISVNNTPPTVNITSPINNSLYSLSGQTTYNLTAQVTDNEQSASQLSYQWQTILHHNNHEHPDPHDNNKTTTTVIEPVGCDGETFYYRIVLTVTDAAGLSATDEVQLYPNCQTPANCTATGTILRELWTNATGFTVSAIPVNNTPSTSSQLTLFETATNSGDNYGQRIRGYICPPTTGNYTFWIASDDEGELWLSTDANPANKRRIAYVQNGAASAREWTKYTSQQSTPIPLQAGQKYYIEALHKEQTGGDNLAVGWQLPAGTLERPIPGNRLSPFVPASNVAPTVSLTAPANGASFAAGANITLTANAADNDGNIAQVEFFRGGISLGIDNTAPYSAVFSNAPIGNYALQAVATDNKGSATSSATMNISVGSTPTNCTATGTILRELWTNVVGATIATIPVNNTPNSSTQINIFETLSNSGDSYGQRIRGYVCPPTTGNYTFWIASDNESELWLSNDANPANKRRIAYILNGFAYEREWTKYTSQQSTPIPLQAGQKYYTEALHKEQTGGDNLAVGWQLPAGTLERPIPGNRLSPFVPVSNVAPTVSLTAPANGASFAAGANITLTANAADNDGNIAQVEFFRGGISLGIDNTAPYSAVFSNAPIGNYALQVVATDNQGSVTSSAIVNISAGSTPTNCTATGTLLQELWTNVLGKTVTTIPVNNTPNSSTQINIFESASNSGDSYGRRVRGYVCPPTTGNYIFWIACDNDGELWLSTDANPANKRRIAYILNGFAYVREWTKYASQQSTPIPLQAGQQYYIEALHKEEYGGDNLAVGWQLPAGTLERPIPGNRLSPFSPNTARMDVEAEIENLVSPLPSLTAHPNPFSHQVTITFTSDHTGEASLDLFDLRGIKLQSIYQGETMAGEPVYVEMDGRALPEGVHVVQLKTGTKVLHHKITLVR